MTAERLVFLQGFEKLPLSADEKGVLLTAHRLDEVLGLQDDEASQLASYLVPYRGSDGAEVFRRGDRESFMCLICSGEIRIFDNGERRRSGLLSSAGPGNTVGEMSLIDGEPRSAYAFAVGETLLFVMTRSNFLRIADQHPVIWGKLLFRIAQLMSHRLRKTNHVLAEHLHH